MIGQPVSRPQWHQTQTQYSLLTPHRQQDKPLHLVCFIYHCFCPLQFICYLGDFNVYHCYVEGYFCIECCYYLFWNMSMQVCIRFRLCSSFKCCSSRLQIAQKPSFLYACIFKNSEMFTFLIVLLYSCLFCAQIKP